MAVNYSVTIVAALFWISLSVAAAGKEENGHQLFPILLVYLYCIYTFIRSDRDRCWWKRAKFLFFIFKKKKSSRCGVADSCSSHFSFLGPRAFESNSFSPTFQHSDRIFPFLTGMEPWKNNTFVNDERKRTDDLSRVVAPTHHHHKFPLSLLSGFSSAIQRRKKKKNFWLLGESEGLCLEMVAYTFKRPRPDRVLVRRRNNNHLNNTVAPVGIYTSPFWRRYIYI